MNNHFPQNLSILRRKAGYTQESFAEALGVSRQAVGKWESGQALPEAATLLTMADLLGCSLDLLMRESLTEEDLSELLDEEEETDPWYLYAQHMDRFSVLIALGVTLVLTGVSLMMALNGLFGENDLTVVPLLLCIAVAVFLFVNGGMIEEDTKKQFPVRPSCPDWEEHESFRQRYRLILPAAVAGILVDVAVMIGGCVLLEQNETMINFVMAGFLGVLAVCVGLLVYMGIQSDKFPKEQ